MKESRYNFYVPLDESKTLVYNAFSNSLIEADPDTVALIKKPNGNTPDQEKLKKLYDMGYIIDENFDEITYLRYSSYTEKYGLKALNLTIAPTLKCNFACPYCYEEEQNVSMDKSLFNKLTALVDKHAANKESVNIIWYGGEPLLEADTINQLTTLFKEICKKHGVTYSAGIVTNGYLVEDVGLDFFKQNINSYIQITLDGPPHLHDQRRYLKGGHPTFWKIMAGIKMLDAAGFQLSLRCNTDQSNFAHLNELIAIVKDAGLKNCNMYLGHVESGNKGCSWLDEKYLKVSDFSSSYVEFAQSLAQNGIGNIRGGLYPRRNNNYCGACSINSYVIDPDGDIYKCWSDIGFKSKSMLNLKSEARTAENWINEWSYTMYDVFALEKCAECKFLPICLGGCPHYYINNGEPKCDKVSFTLESILKKVYQESTALEKSS